MISRSKLSWIFRIGAAALIIALLAVLPAGADTWTQTTDADFENGETFMVEIDGGALTLARGLNNQWTATGEAADDYFGYSVASAGDVNGDGYGDVIVGAWGNDDGTSDAGKAYVYLGSASGLAATASWTATGEATDDYFGGSVASAGDVNGDGYDDVIVGAYRNSAGGSDAGKAYVYPGSASGLAATASWTATGEAAGDGFGYSVASAGGVNGDGYGDVIVGAHYNDDGGSHAGKAYVYLGTASGLAATASWTAIGEAANELFGISVASAGDANGDGYGDVIVGAYCNDDGGSGAGKAYLYGGPAHCEHGFFASEKFSSSGSNIVRWLSISWNPVTQPDGTSVKFQIGTSNDGASFVYMGPDGTADTYYTNPHGQAIYSEQNGKVWRYKAFLCGEGDAKIPTITDLSIIYEEYPYTAPAVTVNLPNGWEILIGGEKTQVTWDASGNLGATPISLYYSTDSGGNWTAIAEEIADTETYTWTVPGVETEEALVKAVVTDIIGNTDSDISDETFVIGLEKDSINLSSGWNFVSTPAKLDNSADEVQQVFAGVNTGGKPIYLYDDGIWNVMSDSDIVMALDGIWIYYASGTNPVPLNFDTNPLTVPIKDLNASWNAIGHSSRVPVTAHSTLLSVESKWTYLIGFDASDQSYEPSIINNDETGSAHDEGNPMYPTEGYWLYMTSAGELGGIRKAGDEATMAERSALPVRAASSSGVPQLPEAYYGTVTLNGLPAPAGTEIAARINGVDKGIFTTTIAGEYGGSGTFNPKLIVAGDAFDVGETITFWLGGMQADQTNTYNWGTNTNLDLSAEAAGVCGDVDENGIVNILDVRLLMNNVSSSGYHVDPWAGDVDGDWDIDSEDVQRLLAYIFDPDANPLACRSG